MSAILRWSPFAPPATDDATYLDGMWLNPDGRFVLYGDHQSAIIRLTRASIEELDGAYGDVEKVVTESARVGALAERARIRQGVLDYYKVAPKAAAPLLRIIDAGEEE